MRKSEVSSVELHEMVDDLRQSSSKIRLLLEHYERELLWLQEEALFLDSIEGKFPFAQNTRH